jgi:hypothetical protein
MTRQSRPVRRLLPLAGYDYATDRYRLDPIGLGRPAETESE